MNVEWYVDNCGLIEYFADFSITGQNGRSLVKHQRTRLHLGATRVRDGGYPIAVTVALVCGVSVAATAQEQPSNVAAPAVPAKELTRAQFQALAPNAVIDFGNERMTKSDFLERNKKAFEEAVEEP